MVLTAQVWTCIYQCYHAQVRHIEMFSLTCPDVDVNVLYLCGSQIQDPPISHSVLIKCQYATKVSSDLHHTVKVPQSSNSHSDL